MGQSRNENILENMLGASNPIGEPQSRIEELLIDIYEQGAGLPDVDQSDDGKVLAVVNGEWDKADIPDGNLPVVTSVDDGKVLSVKNGSWSANDGYAKNDGYYEEMSVGNAEQLISTVMVEDKEPYVKRTSGGGADIGNRLYEKLVGGTIAWNQLSIPANTHTTNQVVCTKNSDGSVTINGTASATGSLGTHQNVTPKNGHIYLVYANKEAWDAGLAVYAGLTSSGTVKSRNTVVKSTTSSSSTISFRATEGQTFTNVKGFVTTFDLTQMFGADIAEFILALETATAGAGVEWIKKLFPKDYYVPNAGTLMSVKAAAHKTVGFNQFNKDAYDEEEDHYPIYLIAGNEYEISPISLYQGTQTVNIYEDADWQSELSITINTTTQRGTFTPTKSEIHYVNIGTHGCSPDELCIHLVWSGKRNGEIEEYKERTYPLDSSLELRGIPKLDANNKFYFDGDTYENDGTVTRKCGIVDLGTLGWNATATIMGHPRANTANPLAGAKPAPSFGVLGNFICDKYVASYVPIGSNNENMAITIHTDGRVYVSDASLDGKTGAQVATALSGVYLVYELAEPTTESAEPWQSPQVVDDFGTEEYIDYGVQQGTRDVAIPVGHETEYPANLVDKVQRSPNLPSADGDYIVRYNNNQAAYVPLESKYPSPPSEDGTYRLTVTVADGEATYSWESEA